MIGIDDPSFCTVLVNGLLVFDIIGDDTACGKCGGSNAGGLLGMFSDSFMRVDGLEDSLVLNTVTFLLLSAH